MRKAAVLLMVVVLVSASPAAAGSVSGWRVTPVVIPRALNGQLSGQSCVSARACMAVGSTATASGLVEPLAEQWNGRRAWMVERPPMPAGARLAQLFSVSCVSARACTAVGRFVTASGVSRSLVERLSRGGWRVVAAVDPAGSPWSALDSVSCSGAAACLAVGDTQTAAGPHLAYSERWDGQAWHLLVTPNLPGAQSAFLDGLACLNATSCMAVGGSDASMLAERWNGTRWHLLAVSSPAGAQFTFLSAVSCASPMSCIAVGGSDQGNVAERWNGSAWHRESVPSPAGSQFSYLAGVSCPTTTACGAVGGYASAAGAFITQGAQRTTHGWSLRVTPNPAHTSGNILGAVTCFDASNCIAVGQANGDGTPVSLGARWNGLWTRLAVPTPKGAAETQLNGVACPTARECLAVGTSGPTAGHLSAVAQRWDGEAWHRQRVPTPPGADLQGIDCTTPRFCMAVGGTASGTLAERWNGARWTVFSTPTPAGSHGASLGAVHCTSASFCMAAGGYCTATKAICDTGNGPNSALTERWNGRRWTELPTPVPHGTVQTFLGGISCTSPSACTTTGETHYPSGVVHTIAERWNGVRWQIQATPNPAGVSFASLGGVACTGISNCIAVGGSDAGNLSERWNGTAWRILSTPTPPGSQGLSSVSCPTRNTCTAAGWQFNLQGGYVLAERWNGTKWTVQPTPLFAGDQDMNANATCPTTRMCMAVGGQESPGPTAIPYAEQWTPGSLPASGNPSGALQPPATATYRQPLTRFNPNLLRLGQLPKNVIPH